MDVGLDLTTVTATRAIDGMRGHFLAAFGRSWVGRRLGRAAWFSFRIALLHGSGLDVASGHARIAAEDRNHRTLLVARWTRGKVHRAVDLAVVRAVNAV